MAKIIELTDNKAKQESLEHELTDLERHFCLEGRSGLKPVYAHTEAGYRIHLLRYLGKDGEVNTHELSQRLAQDGDFNVPAFITACETVSASYGK